MTPTAPTVPDWLALEREARCVAIAKAPVVPVSVAFKPRDRDLTYVPWDGQVYGSLAVVKIGLDPDGKNEECITGYQLIHVPTGKVVGSHRRSLPLRVLALALNRTGLDWESVGMRGLLDYDHSHAIAEAARHVIREWRVRND